MHGLFIHQICWNLSWCLGCVHTVGAPLLWGCSFSLFHKEFIHLCSSTKENRNFLMGINWSERNYSCSFLSLTRRNKDSELLNPIIIFLGAGEIWGTYGMKKKSPRIRRGKEEEGKKKNSTWVIMTKSTNL